MIRTCTYLFFHSRMQRHLTNGVQLGSVLAPELDESHFLTPRPLQLQEVLLRFLTHWKYLSQPLL